MSLIILKGGSGSGKSYKLYETFLRHAADFPNQNHIILVPEQYNLYTQRKLVALSQNGGIMNIEALSFERLAYRVFDELGTSFSDVLSDEGKALLLRRICQENENSLQILSAGIKKTGFIDEIKSLISELMQYDISPQKLYDMLGEDKIRSIGNAFEKRMKDVAVIYEAFIEAMADRYITNEQILSLLVEVIGESSFVKDAYVALDGYTGLTPLQRNLMKEIMPQSEKTYACITIDNEENIYDEDPLGLFSMSRDYAKNLMNIAKESGVAIEGIVETKHKSSVGNNAKYLHLLQSNIFRKRQEKCDDKEINECINIYSFEHIQDELSFIASDISNRIKQDNTLCYKDFAILASDMSLYKYYIEDVFAGYDVNVFIDSKENMDKHPLVSLISALLDVYIYDFSYDAIMNLLDLGFLDLSSDEIDSFDNYITACGIRSKRRMEKAFDRYVGAMDEDDLNNMNDIRSRIMDVVGGVLFKSKGSVKGYTTALYNLMVAIDCENKLSEDDRRVYRKIMDYFDKMVNLLSQEVVELTEYRDILLEGLSSIKIGVLPQSMDTVLFGDMERSRVGDIRVLYMIGMSDSNIPKRTTGGGLLLQSERMRLLDMDIALAPCDRQKVFMERFYIYLALSKPSQNLVITFSEADSDGNGTNAAYFVEDMMGIFGALKIQRIMDEDVKLYHSSKKNLPSNLAPILQKDLRQTKDLSEELILRLAYLKKKDKKAFEMLMSAASYKHASHPLQKSISEAMVGETLDMSVSRLEKYAACAYSYFLQYVLRLKERKEYGMELSDMGNIYHDALKRYSDMVKESEYSWFDLPDEESKKMLESAVESAFSQNEASAYVDTKREANILRRIRGTLERSVWAITSQVKEGMFEPKGFEVSIEKMAAASGIFELDENHRMRMSGIVDRIDTYEDEDNIYIKIIDYKSGGKDIKLSEAYEGLQLQLLFYMKAVCESEKRMNPDKRVVPAAVLYYHVDNPMVDAAFHEGSDQLSETIKRALKNKGLVCSNEDVVEALDQNIKNAKENGQAYNSFSIPVAIKKDGGYNARSSKVLDENDMNTLGEYAAFESVRCGRKIVRGEFDTNPKNDGDTTACDYCPFHSICGFDTKLEGFDYRYLTDEKDNDKILEMMKEKMKAGSDEVDEGTVEGN